MKIFFDWLGALTILLSIYLTGRKIAIGWLVSIVGAIIYGVIAVQNGLWGWVAMEVALSCMNLWNYYKWTRK